MMAFFIEDPFVDKVQYFAYVLFSCSCMKMGLVHDLAESIVGDITPTDNVTEEEKHEMEEVLNRFCRLLVESYFANLQGFPQTFS